MVIAIVGVLIISYFIGCIHGSNIAQLLSGVNLKETGLGNAGASNATLSLGWRYGILVGIIDIGKGIFAPNTDLQRIPRNPQEDWDAADRSAAGKKSRWAAHRV